MEDGRLPKKAILNTRTHVKSVSLYRKLMSSLSHCTANSCQVCLIVPQTHVKSVSLYRKLMSSLSHCTANSCQVCLIVQQTHVKSVSLYRKLMSVCVVVQQTHVKSVSLYRIVSMTTKRCGYKDVVREGPVQSNHPEFM